MRPDTRIGTVYAGVVETVAGGGEEVALLHIRSACANAQAKRFIDGGEERGECQAQRPGESIHDIHGRGLLSAFQIAHVGPNGVLRDPPGLSGTIAGAVGVL